MVHLAFPPTPTPRREDSTLSMYYKVVTLRQKLAQRLIIVKRQRKGKKMSCHLGHMDIPQKTPARLRQNTVRERERDKSSI